MRDTGLADYEGLVGKTAELFAGMVGVEPDDFRQELRLKVVTAKRAFDPTRSRCSERAFIYGAIANLVKDYKKAASRRSGWHVEYIEDHMPEDDETYESQRFVLRYMTVSEEEVTAFVARFVWPSTVSDQEQMIAALLIMGHDHQETADTLGLSKTQVAASLRALREKLADWRPSRTSGSGVPRIPRPSVPHTAPQDAPAPRRLHAVAAA